MRKLKIFVLAAVFVLCFPLFAMASGFNANLSWDGENIIVSYEGFSHGIINSGVELNITNETTGDTYYAKEFDNSINKPITEVKLQTNDNITAPKKNETWSVKFTPAGGDSVTKTVECRSDTDQTGTQAGNGSGTSSDTSGNFESGPIPIFMAGSWEIIKFWYYILASLSGAMIFLVFVKNGYQQMFSSTSNPGLKASFSQSVERCIIAIIVIISAPLLINCLIQINDTLVHLFANTLDHIATASIDLNLPDDPGGDPWLARVVAWPFQAIANFITYFFGLHPLGDVIFNGHLSSTVLSNKTLFMGGLKTSNPFSQALLNLAMLGFTVYFNAVYTIRRWVVIAVVAITPLIIWVWVLTSQRNVIELWLSEIFQTIFMQTWHALTFGIFFSILCFSGGTLSLSAMAGDTTNVGLLFVDIGKWIAGLGGVVCVGVIISQAFKLAVAQNEKEVAEVKQRLGKALVGLIILGLALMIASFLTANQIDVITPNFTEKEETKITFWQLFWVMFTIIPVSKTLSMIFMNIVSRFGTVDENMQASRGLGSIAGLAALGKATGKAAGGKTRKPETAEKESGDSKKISEGRDAKPAYNKEGIAYPSANSNNYGDLESEAYGESETPGIYESGSEYGNNGAINDTEAPGIYNLNSSSAEGINPNNFGVNGVSAAGAEIPGIYDVNSDTEAVGENLNNNLVASGIDAAEGASAAVVDRGLIRSQEENFSRILTRSGAGFDSVTDKVTNMSSNLGAAAGIFTGSEKGMSAFFGGAIGGTAKAIAVPLKPIKTAYDLGKAVCARTGEQGSITGRTTSKGAKAQTLTAIALSPLGSGTAAKAAISIGRHTDKKSGGVDMYAKN